MKTKLNQLGLIGPTYDPQFNNFLRNHFKDIKYDVINNLYNLDKFKKNLRIIKNTDNIYKTANNPIEGKEAVNAAKEEINKIDKNEKQVKNEILSGNLDNGDDDDDFNMLADIIIKNALNGKMKSSTVEKKQKMNIHFVTADFDLQVTQYH